LPDAGPRMDDDIIANFTIVQRGAHANRASLTYVSITVVVVSVRLVMVKR
jgi:hypothetical protein